MNYCNSFVHGYFIAPCSDPGDPAHGWAKDLDFKHGRSVRFQCYRGYRMVGASSITCDDGSWDNRAPVCKGKDTFNYPSDILMFAMPNCTIIRGLLGLINRCLRKTKNSIRFQRKITWKQLSRWR